MSNARKAAILFAAAGFLSSLIYVWYSAWVDDLYGAMPENPVYSTHPSAGAFTDSAWYRRNIALTKYADRKWPILCVGFPVAITMALLLAKMLGWLQHVQAWAALVGLIPIYVVPWLILFLSAISWYVLFIPTLVVTAWILAITVNKITSRRSRAFRNFLVSGGSCLALWLVIVVVYEKDFGAAAWYALLLTLETTWAGIFGIGLAVDLSTRPYAP